MRSFKHLRHTYRRQKWINNIVQVPVSGVQFAYTRVQTVHGEPAYTADPVRTLLRLLWKYCRYRKLPAVKIKMATFYLMDACLYDVVWDYTNRQSYIKSPKSTFMDCIMTCIMYIKEDDLHIFEPNFPCRSNIRFE